MNFFKDEKYNPATRPIQFWGIIKLCKDINNEVAYTYSCYSRFRRCQLTHGIHLLRQYQDNWRAMQRKMSYIIQSRHFLKKVLERMIVT